MSDIHVLAKGLFYIEGHVLLAYNPRYDCFFLPGGHIEPMENAEKSLIRVLQEELGSHDYKIDTFLGVLECPFVPPNSDDYCHSHEYNLIFKVEAQHLSPSVIPESQEKRLIRFQWHPLDKLNELKLFPSSLIKVIPLWLKGDNQSTFVQEMTQTLS